MSSPVAPRPGPFQSDVQLSSRFLVALLSVLTALLFALAWTSTGRLRESVLILAGASASVLLAQLASLLETATATVIRITRRLPLPLFIFSTLILGYLYLTERQANLPSPFPRDDGLIADFTTGAGGPPRNAMGLHFSLLSDNAWNQASKVWYARIPEWRAEADGFLRIYYQLQPQATLQPYVGVYTDFSYPPPRVHTIRRFRHLSLRVRLGQSIAQSPVSISLVLYSANSANQEYAFPSFTLPSQLLSLDWAKSSIPLSDFRRPPWVNYDVPLDPDRVFRVAIVLAGPPGQQAHGHVDLDDLRFE